MTKMITLVIDGVEVSVPNGTTVLKAARKANIEIPTLCYLEGMNSFGGCRMCIVYSEVNGVPAKSMLAACRLTALEGMIIKTSTPEVHAARKMNLELILSNHDKKCLSCARSGSCELQTLSEKMRVNDEEYKGYRIDYEKDITSTFVVRDPNKCILCRRCTSACTTMQNIGVIGPTERGFETIIEPVFGMSLADVPCINCGQCIQACPVGALTVLDETDKVWAAIEDPTKHVVIQTAPAVRAAIGEEFGYEMGIPVTGKMVAALKRIGFDRVFDTNFGADLTIMEEATEFLHRIKTDGTLPMITSCSAGWIKYMEHYYPQFIPNMSTCKSPQQMMGGIINTYYAELNNLDPKDIFSVAVMPCSAKKFEAQRPEMGEDVDVVITTREFAKMIRQAGINFAGQLDEEFDPIFGDSTGAGVIFGVTGGVMEAALRTVYDMMTGKELQKLEFDEIRGMAGVKETIVTIDDIDVKIAVVHGTKFAGQLLDAIESGEKQFDFVEIMACPGGCINGGGQPVVSNSKRMDQGDYRKLRAKALYSEDEAKTLRKSHLNPSVQRVYREYLHDGPGGERSHKILHTKYTVRKKYLND